MGRRRGQERVGELSNGEDALAVEFLDFLLTHSGQQAEVVLLDCFLPTANLEFAFGTMPVKDKIGWGLVGQQCGNFIQSLPRFASQGRGFHL